MEKGRERSAVVESISIEVADGNSRWTTPRSRSKPKSLPTKLEPPRDSPRFADRNCTAQSSSWTSIKDEQFKSITIIFIKIVPRAIQTTAYCCGYQKSCFTNTTTLQLSPLREGWATIPPIQRRCLPRTKKCRRREKH